MTARGTLTIVGQVVGAYIGSLYGMPGQGAAIGGSIGACVGGEVDGPPAPPADAAKGRKQARSATADAGISRTASSREATR